MTQSKQLPDRHRPVRAREDRLNQTCPLCHVGKLMDVSPPTGPRLVRCNAYQCGAYGHRFE